MPTTRWNFNQGQVTSRDRSDLNPGEMQSATGVYYKPGDTGRVHLCKDRTTFAATGESTTTGLGIAQFDNGNAYVLALANGTLYRADAGVTGTFASISTDFSSSASAFSLAHSLDRWYMCDGVSRNRVIESDGSTRDMSLQSPTQQPEVTASAVVGTKDYADTVQANDGWVNTDNAYDADGETYAGALLEAAGTATLDLSFDATSGNTLFIKWGLFGMPIRYEDPDIGLGGGVESGFSVTVTISVSEDAGTNWTPILTQTKTSATPEPQWSQHSLDGGPYSDDDVQVRARMVYNSGASIAVMRLYDVHAKSSGDTSTTTTTGMYYAFTEYDEDTGRESALSPVSALVTLSSQYSASFPLPYPVNNATTHFKIYRTPDGGSEPNQLGYIGLASGGQGSYIDTFDSAIDTQTFPLVPLLEVRYREGTQYFPRDTPAPVFSYMTSFKGRMVGIRPTSRQLWGSYPGRPESFPEINVVATWDLAENDTLVACLPVGDVLVIWSKGVVHTLTEFPEVVQGIFNAAKHQPMRGQPGAVNQNAVTAFSVAGEPRAAWISAYGVHETNSFNARRISDDLDWASDISASDLASASLAWDKQRQLLIANIGTTEYLFHMAPEHQKANGMPKVTKGPSGRRLQYATTLLSNVDRLYSCDATGTVYLEENGTGSGATLTLPRSYTDWSYYQVNKASLRHTSMNATATFAWSCGRDDAGDTQAETISVSLNGQQGTEFPVMLAGEWHEVTITIPSAVTGALQDLRVDYLGMGKAGTTDV